MTPAREPAAGRQEPRARAGRAVSHRRGAAVGQAVLDTALALLAERGYDFTVDDVAERAGVHKTTVYRRWETKAQLVAAAVQQLADRDVVGRDTGDALADLEELTLQVAGALRRPAGVNALRAALSSAGADAELRGVAAGFLAGRYAMATRLLRAAQDDGLVRRDLDPTLVWQAIVNPLHLNAVLGGPLDDATARGLLRIVLDGARVPGGRRHGPDGVGPLDGADGDRFPAGPDADPANAPERAAG